MGRVRTVTDYREHDKSTYLRLKVQTFVSHTSTYWYILSTYFFAYSHPVPEPRWKCYRLVPTKIQGLYRLFYISKGYIPGTCWLWWSTYFGFLIPLQPAQPHCLQAIQAPAHASNQITLRVKHWQVYSLLLGSTLVSAWAPVYILYIYLELTKDSTMEWTLVAYLSGCYAWDPLFES